MKILNELEEFSKEWNYHDFSSITFNEDDEECFEILYPLFKKSDGLDSFMWKVLLELRVIHHQRILWNCETLLDNCVDPEISHLEFKRDIREGFRASEILKELGKMDDNVTLGEVRALLSTISDI
jgi:hypothetical protein